MIGVYLVLILQLYVSIYHVHRFIVRHRSLW